MSIAEHRPDGSQSPKVGAVLVRPDGSIETAARGELRDGNHAEFTLLERKCVGEKLDGCVLFTTLEPCLDRNHPKRGCAKHIVGARIKEVYVGIEDDNPTVRGKGNKYLEQHGVAIRLCDPDLGDVIYKENKAFFEWARQQPEKPESKPIKLSKYEDPVTAVVMKDLSNEALEYYRVKAKIAAPVGSSEFVRRLQQQGSLTEVNGAVVPTGFGLLLFGKEPRNALPQAGVLARAELANGQFSRMEFGQAMVLVPKLLEEWLITVLPSTIDRSQMERKEQVDLPFEMLREAVVNALVHRDYDIAGQKCQLFVNADTITIKSPGGLISPTTLKQMRSFSASMRSRNPVLHYVFARMGFAEEQGFGLSSLRKNAEALGLPLPTFALDGDILVLTIYRNRASSVAGLPSETRARLKADEQAAWAFISGRQTINSSELAKRMDFDERKTQRVLKKLADAGLLVRAGQGPATFYEVIRR